MRSVERIHPIPVGPSSRGRDNLKMATRLRLVPNREGEEPRHQVSLPRSDRLLDGHNAFTASLAWPETRQR